MKAGTGERGIFNKGSLITQLPERRIKLLDKKGYVVNGRITGAIGTNPCAEIILQSKQFCNLSEVIARSTDTPESLKRKIRIATILGTYQSSMTNFNYISKQWKENCESERLLGLSITGQWDCPAVRDAKVLEELRDEAIEINKKYSKRFGTKASTCITAVKPSGSVSQTVNCSSGMHARFSPYYIRRVRISATDSLYKMLRDQGVPAQPEVGQSEETANTFVLEFPVKSPKGSVYSSSLSAIDQLEHWKLVKTKYTEHNPSVTISISEDEWIEVANFVYSNWDIVGGLSFLPRSDHVYKMAPYEEISKDEYTKRVNALGDLDFSKLINYEQEDNTTGAKEFACVGGTCEI